MNKISEFSEKLEKWKIFRFIGKKFPSANVPIHVILVEKSGQISTFSIQSETWHTYRPVYIKFRNFGESWKNGKFSDLSEIFLLLQMFQFM